MPDLAPTNACFVHRIHQATACIKDDQAVAVDNYPVIDLRPWLVDEPASTDDDRQAVVEAILEQAKGAGSFQITGHGVPASLWQRLESTSRAFFALDMETKLGYSSGTPMTGYEFKETKDLKEVFGMVHPDLKGINVGAPNDYQQALDEYLMHMDRLERLLYRLLTLALIHAKNVDLPDDFLGRAREDRQAVFRTLYYPDIDSKYQMANKMQPHSDWGGLTILTSTAKGLEEIRDHQWVEVPCQPGRLHVILSEMLVIWSNGLFQNNIHRVSSAASGQEKLSFAYFTANGPTRDDVVAVPPVCAEGEERLFAPTTIAEHFDNYFALFTKEGNES